MRKRGFTLIELLLVVLIMAMAAAMVIPQYIRSMRGASMRTSVNTVRMISRHARAMAVLQQKHMGLRYDENSGKIEIITMQRDSNKRNMDFYNMEMAGYRNAGLGDANDEIEAEFLAEQHKLYGVESVLTKKIEKGIRITDFELLEGGELMDSEIHAVNFWPTGIVQGHKFVLVDDKDNTAEVEIDSITGDFSVEYKEAEF